MQVKGLPGELGQIVTIAEEAGQAVLYWFGKTHATPKPDGTLATEADLAAEEVILERLARLYPSDAVSSEETFSICRVGKGRLWSVDPLDGTHNLSAGLPIWAISIGLVEGGKPVLGVVHSPPFNLTFAGAAGLSVWRNGEQLAPAPATPLLCNDLVAYTSERPGPLFGLPHKSRNLGSACLHGCLTVSGLFRAALFSNWVLWDLAAVLCFAGELQVEARWMCGDLLEDLSLLESATRQDHLLLAPRALCDQMLATVSPSSK
jgi:myo-inositol-1(or 4)-monophosphatase